MMDKYINMLDLRDRKAEERYKHAINLEKAKHASELARKAEKLRLLYKTRFQEDLRAFLIVHKNQENICDLSEFRKEKEIKVIQKDISNKNSSIQKKDKNSKIDYCIPTWAWPASLRNNENLKLISLFYTAETTIPVSPTQIGGNFKRKDIKITQIPSEINKILNAADVCEINNSPNSNGAKIQRSSININLEKNTNKKQRQKLHSRYGAPFSWIKNKTLEKANIENSPSIKSESSTSQSQIFTEIPKQPSIYPLEFVNDTNNLDKNRIHDFIKKTQKMQRTLDIILENSFENNGRTETTTPLIFKNINSKLYD